MQINWDQTILDLEKNTIDFNGSPLTVRRTAILSLVTPDQNETLVPEDKFKMGKLASDISDGAYELTTEECALIKKQVGKIFNSLIVYKMWNILEGK